MAKDSKQKKKQIMENTNTPKSTGLLAKVIIWKNIIWIIMWENMNMFMPH